MSKKTQHSAPAAKKTKPARDVHKSTSVRRVRDRIFDTACELFYEHGIRAVGVDAIASAAGTNKMSFYRNFSSKDELVAEYLRANAQESWRWWDDTIAQHPGDPRRQIEALFEAYVPHAEEHCSRGCAIANAAVECSDADGVVSNIIREHQAETRRRLRALAHAMQARDPDILGDALMLLIEGGYSTQVAKRSESGPMCAALAAARALLDAHKAPR
jgi:AcrR family transcriptional regulator